MRIIDAQHFLLFIPFGNPSSYGGSSELVFPSNVLEISPQTHSESCFQCDSKHSQRRLIPAAGTE